MTVSKALSLFDEERKNSISEALKINWLSQLDMKIFCELLKPRTDGSFSGYTESTPKSTKLLAPEEYAEIYTAYLIMQSDLLNGETATGYAWKYEGSTYVRGTGETFMVPSNFMDGDKDGSLAQKKLYCEITYSGGTVETPHYPIEKYVNYLPHSDKNKDGNNSYAMLPNKQDSAEAYTFSVDGKRFVLADSRNVNDNAYFVMALDAYGDIFNGDTTGKQSTTAWKNYKGQTGFQADSDGKTIQDYIFTTGNNFESLGSDHETRYTLPLAFKDYINYGSYNYNNQ